MSSMTDIPDAFISKAKEIYESNWPDPVLAIAEALMKASNTTPAQKAGGGSLKPCPFCGGEPAEPDGNNHTWCTETSCGSDAYLSVEAWNRRADDPRSMNSEALAAHIAELQQILREKQEVQSW